MNGTTMLYPGRRLLHCRIHISQSYQRRLAWDLNCGYMCNLLHAINCTLAHVTTVLEKDRGEQIIKNRPALVRRFSVAWIADCVFTPSLYHTALTYLLTYCFVYLFYFML